MFSQHDDKKEVRINKTEQGFSSSE